MHSIRNSNVMVMVPQGMPIQNKNGPMGTRKSCQQRCKNINSESHR